MARTFDCRLDDHLRLSGQIVNYYAGKGLMHFNSSSMKGKHLLALWLDHLTLCASEQYQHQDSNWLITRDSKLSFERLNSTDAIDALRDYGELYYQGLAYPLPVFPLSSYAWCRADNPEKALKAANTAWYGNDYNNIPGDKDDAYIKLALRGSMQEPFSSAEFDTFAQALYANALKCVIET